MALFGITYVAAGLTDLKASLERMVVMADQPQELRTAWVDTAGLNQSVVTYRNAGEGNVAFVTRHSDTVTAMLAAHPKAP